MVKFYHCKECGQLVAKLNDAACKPACCGHAMEELVAGTVDAAREKHVPEITREGNKVHVQVGSAIHPMEEKHWIEMIALVQGDKVQIKTLKPGDEPKADFIADDGKLEVYEFCNLHGLWMAEA